MFRPAICFSILAPTFASLAKRQHVDAREPLGALAACRQAGGSNMKSLIAEGLSARL
jgi:hypothetical protein